MKEWEFFKTRRTSNGSNIPLLPEPITLSQLEPHTLYNLYRYNNLDAVPDSNFNAHTSQAYENWQMQIEEGTTYVMTQQILSNDIAIYRAVKANAP